MIITLYHVAVPPNGDWKKIKKLAADLGGFYCPAMRREGTTIKAGFVFCRRQSAEDFAVGAWETMAVYEPSPDGGYTVTIRGLPECISEGETVEEARANVREALALLIEE